jgi:hypothetical protein
LTDDNRQRLKLAHQPLTATCDRLVCRLSDHERGIWTPKPFERVSIAMASGDELLGTFIAASSLRAVVIVDDLDGAADWFRTYRWDELAPAPPLGCECPACSSNATVPSACDACDCGACPFVHECGCAEHGCGCPAGGCTSAQ